MEENEIKGFEKLLKMYNDLEMELLLEICKHFLINEEFTNSDYWRIAKLQEMGVFNEQVVKYIALATKSTPMAVKKALEELGYDTYNISKLKGAFEDGMISIDPQILIENGVIETIVRTQYNELTNQILTLSEKIEEQVKREYINIVEQTYLKTATGTHSYQEAIQESINDLSKKGISTLTYITRDTTGEVVGTRSYDVEGAVRRDILTNTRNLSNSINEEIVKDLKPKYLKLSEHINCRPTHFDWQGTIIEADKLEEITGYGEVDGLGGINCRHYFEPYFGDKRGNDLKKYSQKECDEAYKQSQKQRYLERGIRTWKRKERMFKAIGDNENYIKSREKTKLWIKRYEEYSKRNDLKADYIRTYISD